MNTSRIIRTINLLLLFLLLPFTSVQAKSNASSDSCALVDLFHALDGHNWKHNDNWLNSPDLGTWYGITTHPLSGRVMNINLDTNALHGAIPLSISDLTELQILKLSGDRGPSVISALPTNLDGLVNLRKLSLYRQQISSLPPLDSLNQLIELNISENPIDSLPSLEGLHRLQRFHMVFTNIDSLPELPHPERLLFLNADRSKLKSLPDLAPFKNLGYLNVRHNDIANLINLDSLKHMAWLDLSFNPLGFTPPFEKLDRLIYLSLGSIQMDSLPPLYCLTQLKYFGISDNNIRHFPPLDSNLLLEQLFFDQNLLTELPPIGHLSRLEVLIGYSNLLDTLVGLDNVTSLVSLDLQDNLFSNLQDLSRLKELTSFKVALNSSLQELKGIHPNIQTKLAHFFISKSAIQDIHYFPTVGDLRCAHASLNFDDLLPYASLQLPANRYAPQGLIPLRCDTLRDSIQALDTAIVLTPISGGNVDNSYTWSKNNSVLSLPNSQRQLTLSLPLAPTDTGTYMCQVTHPAFPSLTLTTVPKFIASACGLDYPMKLRLRYIDDGNCTPNTASARVDVLGGVAPFAFTWYSTPIQTGSTANMLSGGSYLVEVQDQNNCKSQFTVTIPCVLGLDADRGDHEEQAQTCEQNFHVYDDPMADQLIIHVCSEKSKRIHLSLFSSHAKQITKQQINITEERQLISINIPPQASGIYIVSIIFEDGRHLHRDCLKSLNRLIFSRLLRILAKELPRNKPKLA